MSGLVNQALLNYVLFAELASSLRYRGPWNAQANVPQLRSYRGTKNTYYLVTVAGNTELNGISDWQVGDWALFNGRVWTRVPVGQQVPPGWGSGNSGNSGSSNYTHVQNVAATTWTVNHNLGRHPRVTIIRASDGAVVYAAVTHLNANSLRIDFSEALAGRVYCD